MDTPFGAYYMCPHVSLVCPTRIQQPLSVSVLHRLIWFPKYNSCRCSIVYVFHVRYLVILFVLPVVGSQCASTIFRTVFQITGCLPQFSFCSESTNRHYSLDKFNIEFPLGCKMDILSCVQESGCQLVTFTLAEKHFPTSPISLTT